MFVDLQYLVVVATIKLTHCSGKDIFTFIDIFIICMHSTSGVK